MNYVFVREPRVWWPVTVRVPADGGVAEQKFEARLRIVATSTFNELLEAGAGALLETVVLDWRGILDEEGQPLAFSRGALEALLDLPYVTAALSDAYAEAMLSGARKN